MIVKDCKLLPIRKMLPLFESFNDSIELFVVANKIVALSTNQSFVVIPHTSSVLQRNYSHGNVIGISDDIFNTRTSDAKFLSAQEK